MFIHGKALRSGYIPNWRIRGVITASDGQRGPPATGHYNCNVPQFLRTTAAALIQTLQLNTVQNSRKIPQYYLFCCIPNWTTVFFSCVFVAFSHRNANDGLKEIGDHPKFGVVLLVDPAVRSVEDHVCSRIKRSVSGEREVSGRGGVLFCRSVNTVAAVYRSSRRGAPLLLRL